MRYYATNILIDNIISNVILYYAWDYVSSSQTFEHDTPEGRYRAAAKGEARIRVQLSAAHEKEHVDRAIEAFKKVGEKYEILGKSKDEIVEKYGL